MNGNIELHLSGRATGRTSRMIDWLLADSDRVIACHSQMEASRIRKLVQEKNPEIKDWQVISYGERQYLAGKSISSIGIDNLELFLLYFFPYTPVEYVTALRASNEPYNDRGFDIIEHY